MKPAVTMCLASLVLGACADTDRASDAFTVRDSAGIRIVENASAAWAEGEEWRLSEEPAVSIGVAEGPDEYQLFRVSSALRLATGEIVVANAGTNELRFYDATGRFLRATGGEGEGPGEYTRLAGIWRLAPDSLLAYDQRNRRVGVLSVHGEFARSFTIERVPGGTEGEPAGVFDDRTLLAFSRVSAAAPETTEGVGRYPNFYGRFNLEGKLIDTLPRLYGWEMFSAWMGEGWLGTPVPYARLARAAVSGDRWYYGTTDRWEIEVYSADGRITGLIRRGSSNRPVTAQMVEEYREAARASSSRGIRIRAEIPIPETMPAYGDFRVDDGGNLWVAEYKLEDEQPSWAVFDSEGRFLGTVDTPLGVRVTHFGAAFVLGVWSDDTDVEYVRMYELIKP